MRFYFYILLNIFAYLYVESYKKIILKKTLKLGIDQNEKYVFLCNKQ